MFNSPYNRMAGGSIEVAGKLVEDHLFDSVRGLWTKDSMRKRCFPNPSPSPTSFPLMVSIHISNC